MNGEHGVNGVVCSAGMKYLAEVGVGDAGRRVSVANVFEVLLGALRRYATGVAVGGRALPCMVHGATATCGCCDVLHHKKPWRHTGVAQRCFSTTTACRLASQL